MDRRKDRESGVTTGQRLLQWMKALDQPRPAGSGAEREAAMYIAKTIRMAGGEPETESFPIWLCEQTAALTVSGIDSKASVLHIPVRAYDRPVRQSDYSDLSLDGPVWNEETEQLEAGGPLVYV